MFESEVADALESAGIDIVVSLPCDKNKGFTDLIHERFRVVDVTREEDGVGICAGAFLMGRKPAMSIQSSGLGNMMNALMSLTSCYGMPLLILASWRGMEGETIEAQKPFNSKIPEMLDCYGISHAEVTSREDIHKIKESADAAYSNGEIHVVLIRPEFWKGSERTSVYYPARNRTVRISIDKEIVHPSMTRLDAVKAAMDTVGKHDIVVSNIGVPSKDVFASNDRPMNFYMLGSYTQATPIGLGMAVSSERKVMVIDGDGSLLGSSIFPVLSAERPCNLTVVCLDNGTFGSTGNQMNQAYSDVDMGAVAQAYGLKDVRAAHNTDGVHDILSSKGESLLFLQAFIAPGNSDSKNIPYSAAEIKRRFMRALDD